MQLFENTESKCGSLRRTWRAFTMSQTKAFHFLKLKVWNAWEGHRATRKTETLFHQHHQQFFACFDAHPDNKNEYKPVTHCNKKN